MRDFFIGSVAYVANEQLVKCLQCEEERPFACSFYVYPAFVYFQFVVLAAFESAVDFEQYYVLVLFCVAECGCGSKTFIEYALQLANDKRIAVQCTAYDSLVIYCKRLAIYALLNAVGVGYQCLRVALCNGYDNCCKCNYCSE